MLHPEPGRIGICCSGGGIRSAAYNLGALQSLREEGVLDRAAYLSAVSGGSYIAAAHIAVLCKSDPALLPPSPSSGATVPPGGEGRPPQGPKSVFGPGSPEELYLRNRSSYMAPGAEGKIRLVLRIALGMLVNLVLMGTVLWVAGRLVGWSYADFSFLYPNFNEAGSGDVADIPSWVVKVLSALAIAGVVLGVVDLVFRLRWERFRRLLDAWSTRFIAAALIGSVLLIALPELIAWLRTGGPDNIVEAVTGMTGGDTADGKAPPSGCAAPAQEGVADPSCEPKGSTLLQLLLSASVLTAILGALRGFFTRRRTLLALIAGAVAGPLLVLSAFVWSVNDASARGVEGPDEQRNMLIALCMVGFYLAFANPTQWSLHPFYRRRLSSAFFVRRTPGTDGEVLAKELEFGEPIRLSGLEPKATFPELIVCAAANVSDLGATPPGRSAASFTFSLDEIGGWVIGGMPAEEYERKIDKAGRDVTLPAAVAMSGAAFSPSMGKLSIRPLTFLMALMNLRLGVWIPNPRWLKDDPGRIRKLRRMRPPPWYFFYELFGTNKLRHHFLYVTDGGHYDNLGLVELLRRGCTTIFCLDASGDTVESFNTLGETIGLARSDLQVDVEVDPHPMLPDESGTSAADHVIGTFHYPSGGPAGTLVFCKAAVTAEAPWDVRAFREDDPRFPNHSTFDQLFDDRKFESYRALGAHTLSRATRAWMEAETRACARRTLIATARQHHSILYAALRRKVAEDVPRPVRPPPGLAPLLREIDEHEQAYGRPRLSVVITDGEDEPSALSRTLGQSGNRQAEREWAWEYWAATPPPREEITGETPGGRRRPVPRERARPQGRFARARARVGRNGRPSTPAGVP